MLVPAVYKILFRRWVARLFFYYHLHFYLMSFQTGFVMLISLDFQWPASLTHTYIYILKKGR
jgi:hypothetical protein